MGDGYVEGNFLMGFGIIILILLPITIGVLIYQQSPQYREKQERMQKATYYLDGKEVDKDKINPDFYQKQYDYEKNIFYLTMRK